MKTGAMIHRDSPDASIEAIFASENREVLWTSASQRRTEPSAEATINHEAAALSRALSKLF